MYKNSNGVSSRHGGELVTANISLPPLDPSPRMSIVNEGLSKRSSRQELNTGANVSQQSLQPITKKNTSQGFILPTEENDHGTFNRKNSRYNQINKTNSRLEVASQRDS